MSESTIMLRVVYRQDHSKGYLCPFLNVKQLPPLTGANGESIVRELLPSKASHVTTTNAASPAARIVVAHDDLHVKYEPGQSLIKQEAVNLCIQNNLSTNSVLGTLHSVTPQHDVTSVKQEHFDVSHYYSALSAPPISSPTANTPGVVAKPKTMRGKKSKTNQANTPGTSASLTQIYSSAPSLGLSVKHLLGGAAGKKVGKRRSSAASAASGSSTPTPTGPRKRKKKGDFLKMYRQAFVYARV